MKSLNLKAIAIGSAVSLGLGLVSLAVLTVGLFCLTVVLTLLGIEFRVESEPYRFWLYLTAIVLGALNSLCGGIVTSRRTRGTEFRHTFVVSLVLVVESAVMGWVSPEEPYAQNWVWIGYATCFMPLVGAFVVRRQQRRRITELEKDGQKNR